MDLSLSASHKGSPTCSAGGIWLHSRYDPEREARRFAESEIAQTRPSHVLLLGPCLDYLPRAVRALLPRAKIVALQYSAFFADALGIEVDAVWHPGLGSSLEAFLDSALDEDAISGVAVLEWDPASRAFPGEAAEARRALKASLGRLAASTATVKTSGRRWIANACSSFLLIEKSLAPEKTRVPILIAAAGPSLGASLLSLGKFRGRFATIAVSSALAACRAAGIEPDLVVSTDGGYWSRLHLYPLADRALPLASPLTALPTLAIYRGSGLVLLDQGSFVESELLPALGPARGGALMLPPHGTVSGSALQLAARLSEGPLIVAGLDLASYGDLDHARPHGFDAVLAHDVSRVAPQESKSWARCLESTPLSLPERPWRCSRALAAYAGALGLDSATLAGRLYRIGPSPVRLRGFVAISASDLASLLGPSLEEPAKLRLKEQGLPEREERELVLASKLAAWRRASAQASAGLGEGRLPREPLVAELLRSIDIVDYAAARRAVLSGGEPQSAARALSARCDLFLSGLERRFAL